MVPHVPSNFGANASATNAELSTSNASHMAITPLRNYVHMEGWAAMKKPEKHDLKTKIRRTVKNRHGHAAAITVDAFSVGAGRGKPVKGLPPVTAGTATGITIQDAFPDQPADLGNPTDHGNADAFGPDDVMAQDEVNQGGTADCYFLAVLLALAGFAPNYLRQLIQRDRDAAGNILPGKWRVYFTRSGAWFCVHVSCVTGSNEANAADASFWVQIMETAYAFFRNGTNTIAGLNYGFTTSVFLDFGISLAPMVSTVAGLRAALAAGQLPTLLTLGGSAPPNVILSHAYAPDVQQPNGNVFTWRNPWGILFPGYLHYNMTDADIPRYFYGMIYTGAKPGAMPTSIPLSPIPGDANGDGVVDFTDYNAWLAHTGSATTAGAAEGDFNGDGFVDFTDYNIWLANVGNVRKP